MSETYTPGHTQNAVDFMSRRSLESHGQFFLPSEATAAYAALQSRNGGNLRVGALLGGYLREAGFQDVRMAARYECYSSLGFIGEYLALQLERQGDTVSASTLREWSCSDGGMFAQAWVSAIARKA
jgi:hypothetical protein